MMELAPYEVDYEAFQWNGVAEDTAIAHGWLGQVREELGSEVVPPDGRVRLVIGQTVVFPEQWVVLTNGRRKFEVMDDDKFQRRYRRAVSS